MGIKILDCAERRDTESRTDPITDVSVLYRISFYRILLDLFVRPDRMFDGFMRLLVSYEYTYFFVALSYIHFPNRVKYMNSQRQQIDRYCRERMEMYSARSPPVPPQGIV